MKHRRKRRSKRSKQCDLRKRNKRSDVRTKRKYKRGGSNESKSNYVDMLVSLASRLKDISIDLEGEWGKCEQDCFEISSELIDAELDHVQYYMNVIQNGFINKDVIFTPPTHMSWSTAKDELSIQSFKTKSVHRKSVKGGKYYSPTWSGGDDVDIIVVSGPSASGKTFWTKMGLLDHLYPSTTFFVIDGGDYRELSVMYQLINLLAKTPMNELITQKLLETTNIKDKSLIHKLAKLQLSGWGGQGIVNLNPTTLKDFASRKTSLIQSSALFDSDIVKNYIREFILQLPDTLKFTLVIPDTLSGTKDIIDSWSYFQRPVKQCLIHVYQHYSGSSNKREARPYVLDGIQCCNTTLVSGTERETQEGKKYTTSASTWLKSHKKGLTLCLQTLQSTGFCIIIHNNNNKDNHPEILQHSTLALWYNSDKLSDISSKVRGWITSLQKHNIRVQYKEYPVSETNINHMKPLDLVEFESDLYDFP